MLGHQQSKREYLYEQPQGVMESVVSPVVTSFLASTCSAQLNNHLVGAENKNKIRRLAVASSYYDPSGLGQLRISKHWALVFLNLRSSWPRKGLTPPKERSGTRQMVV